MPLARASAHGNEGPPLPASRPYRETGAPYPHRVPHLPRMHDSRPRYWYKLARESTGFALPPAPERERERD